MQEFGTPFSRNAYRLGIYGALITGAIIFSIPFVWMVSTSLKEDDEQMQKELVWLPRLPPYCPRSPYIDARGGTALVRPAGMKPESWSVIEPLIAPALAAVVDAVPADAYGTTPPETARGLLTAALWQDISGKIPDDKLNPAGLPGQIARFAGKEQIDTSLERIFRAIDIGTISLRAAGESAEVLRVGVNMPAGPGAAESIDSAWSTVDSPETAQLTRRVQKSRVDTEIHYDFRDAGSRVQLEAELPFAKTSELKTFSLRLKGDASWNRLWTALEVDGKRYEAKTPSLLFGKRYGEIFFQLPSPDDDNDLRIRDWIATREVPGTFNEKGRVKLIVTVENTSGWTKLCDKFTYNYSQALHYIPFWRYVLTSLFLVGMNIVLSIFSSSLVAYSFARLNWPGRKYCWALLLATVMIPGQVTLIPTFLIIKWLGWFNTLLPLWFGSSFGSVFFIFMLREFMKGIPKDLEDAAKIDGCNYWQIYWNVILPLVRPTLAAIGIFTFMGTWNDFMGPLMYLSDQSKYPLSLGLFAFQTVAGGNQGMLMAASLLMTLPVIALFFVAQRHFIQGLAFSGIKG